ncbi:MAG: TonB-dependent receptor [Prevotellaceae bacterium]|nr:TonB-dependent receptor [Prevotellaceae bacterium]
MKSKRLSLKNKTFAFVLGLLWMSCPALSAQSLTVSGNIAAKADGQSIIGATVIENSTSNGTITDTDGNFTLTVPTGAWLTISYIGYKQQTVKAQPTLRILLEEDTELLDEVVVTGYMSEKKASLTGSVSVVKMRDVADIPTGNVMNSLQGRVAGMNIVTDGTPGGMTTSALVRGTTTINNSSPLYVIDGVQTRDNIASILSSGDVESIQVLKDASSAAIYGAQAANGVIIITTKRAKEGDIRVNFDLSLTAQTFSTGFDMLTAGQWGEVYWQAYRNSYGTHPNSVVYGNGDTPVMQAFYYDEGGTKIRTADTDWAKEIFDTALMQNYNLSLSKGFKDGEVSLTLNYLDQDGLIRHTDFQRFNTRLASNFRFWNGRIRVGESVAVNRWTRHLNPAGIEEAVIAQHPAIPVYDENGGYAGGYVDILGDKPNLVRLTDNEADNRHTYWRIFGNAFIEIEPIKNLVFKSNFGLNYYTEFNSTFVPAWREASRSVTDNELNVTHHNSMQWVWSNTLNYTLNIDRHALNLLAGTEAKKESGESLTGYGRNLVIEEIDYRYLDAVTSGQIVGNNAAMYAMVSYFGKVNYAYDDRYLLSATLRRDASSRFGQNKNAALFPSVSAGWRISREKFMEPTADWLSDLKLRASWGVNGNDMIDNTATYSKYLMSLKNASYNLNGDGTTLAPGAYKTASANKDLRWEQTQQLNIGIDASFLGNRLGVTLDYFNKNTSDMLIQRPYIGVIGEGGYYWYNGISMNNRGFETTLTWRDDISDFHYDIALNLSFYRNRITDLPQDIYYTYGGGNGTDKSVVGQSFGSWMGYKTDGLFRTQEEVYEYLAEYDVQIGSPEVGRIRYADVNGDHKITTADQTWLGSDQPKVIGGLNLSAAYKGFDLSLFFNGMVRDAWNNSKYYTDLFQCWTGNHSTRLLDAMQAWTAYEQSGVYNSNIPALVAIDNNNESRGSQFYIEDGSYIKLKSLTVGYTLPQSLTRKWNLSNVRLYLQSQNLFTLTGYTGADPEGLGYTYPQPRTYTFGLTVGF